MINALTLILSCQLAGEFVVAALGLPVPGPVVGMALLLGLFIALGRIPATVASAGDGLLANLALMFVPAGVGIMLHASLLGSEGPSLGIALVFSTLVAIAISALVMRWFTRSGERSESERAP